ncbi:hypothetical protein HUG10_20975 (plasmid) [Halorarum halophilum]|uniref:Uncharacterized protein n=1 Tax=Halorarum halophilum TaxID=2743090 RepID=A0A7D5K405_9EURY|nr:hypothetical protein [Halobaculum halophilum]QLG30061.1 hypothetical protein HUG10_20975 [Halobaculum halophilum]
MCEYALNHCISCGSENVGGFMATERIASVSCDDCGIRFNIDDINGDLEWGRDE